MPYILLVRHAQSANNALPVHLRVCDPGLTPLGYQQAEATARALTGYPIRTLYCSPFLRSLETTQAVANGTGKNPVIHGDLFEQGGCYSGHVAGSERGEPGLGRRELARRYPGWLIDQRIHEDGWWGRAYESMAEAAHRASRVREWLEGSLMAQEVSLDALIIHADFKRLLVRELLGSAWTNRHDEQLGPLYNAGISLLEFSEGRWVLRMFNAVSHLPANCWTT